MTSSFAAEAPKLGGLAEALLLSFGLGSRIRRAREEKERAQAELLSRERAHADSLERRVEERTRALTAAQDRMVSQAKLALFGRLVAGVAHEVGNPLNFALGGAQEADRRLGELEATLPNAGGAVPAEAVTRAVGHVRRSLRLVHSGHGRIRGVLDNLRAHLQGKEAPLVEADLVAELESTLALVEPRLQQQGIRVEKQLVPLPPVRCRPGEVNQVFLNLLLNGAQAMPGGGVLRLSAERGDGQLRLRFADTGPGVPPGLRASIFEPFFSTRAPAEGTGLGLTLSRDILQRLGGELRLEDTPTGASFVVELPVAAQE